MQGHVTKMMSAFENEAEQLRSSQKAFRQKGQNLCTSYSHLGCWWLWPQGWRTTIPKAYKKLAAMWIHPRVWNAVRLSRLNDQEVDRLCDILFGILPDCDVRGLLCERKEDFWQTLLEEHNRLMEAQPQRCNALAADLSNVEAVALTLGLPNHFIPSPEQLEKAEKTKIKEKAR